MPDGIHHPAYRQRKQGRMAPEPCEADAAHYPAGYEGNTAVSCADGRDKPVCIRNRSRYGASSGADAHHCGDAGCAGVWDVAGREDL